MWSNRENERVCRFSNGVEQPNYLRYNNVFMTSRQSNVRRPANRINPIRSNVRQPFLSPDKTDFIPPRSMFAKEGRGNPFSARTNKNTYTPNNERFDLSENFDMTEPNDNCVATDTSECFTEEYFGKNQFDTNTNSILDYPSYQYSQNGLRFRKRQLPQLQQYRNTGREDRQNSCYWDDCEDYIQPRKKSKYKLSFPAVWQKFVITFTSLLSLVCLTWIAYNRTTPVNDDSEVVIKPKKSSFKVLPDVPGEIEIPYRDKTVYNRVAPNIQIPQSEHVVPSVEDAGELPLENKRSSSIPNYTIIDDRDYYIKYHKSSNALASREQISAIKRKLSLYENRSVIEGISCTVRKVANAHGQLGEFILIGPFNDDTSARKIGKYICELSQIPGEIISVQKKNS